MMSCALLLVATTTVAQPTAGHDLRRFLFPNSEGQTAFKEGSAKIEWEGHGRAQLNISWSYLDKRDEKVASAQAVVGELIEAVERARQAVTEETKQEIRSKIANLSNGPLDKAEKDLVAALILEEKRLKMVIKAADVAKRRGDKTPDIDVDLVKKLIEELDAEEKKAAITKRVAVYRNISQSITAYLDGDVITAIEHMREAEREAKDILLVHVYLGSFYYLVRQPKRALEEWKKALALDPDNVELQQAVEEFSAGNR